MRLIVSFLITILISSACKNNNETDLVAVEMASIPAPANINYRIVKSYPHDTSSYTQGLIWYNKSLYEGTGDWGRGHMLRVDINTGKSNKSLTLDPAVFGEGITIINDKIYQLTWQNKIVYVYDVNTFKKIKEYHWEHEGWGITNNGTDFIISTGESNLYVVDTATFKIKATVSVTDNNGPVGNLNELEYVKGYVYANIYLTDYIIKIDPSNGHIVGKIDLSNLLAKAGKYVNTSDGLVLNGIAYDDTKRSFYITGKKWPLLFEMKLE